MKAIISKITALLLATASSPLLSQAPSTNAPRPRPAPPTGLRVAGTNAPTAAVGTNLTNRPARNRLPFQGAVKSTDATAMTITLSGAKDQDRLLRMDGETKLIKAGKPATIAEIASADYARGLLKRNDRGEDVIVHATFGPKPTPKPKAKNPAAMPATPTTPPAGNSPKPTPTTTPR